MTELASVAVDGTVPDPQNLRMLKVKLHGIEAGRFALSGDRQSYENGILTIRKESPDRSDASGGGAALKDKAAYLGPSPFIQSDHAEIVKALEGIVKPDDDAETRMKKIVRWVYGYLEKQPVLSVSNALETLRHRRGDCTEHAVLTAALARAAGIPATVETGLVYQRGRFYYHAWNVFWIDSRKSWVTADAVFDQVPADVTHIRFVRGEMQEQLDLIGLIGRLRLEGCKVNIMIELKDLRKQYDRVLAVDNLNLHIEAGEIFGFIGPNGAGKTTTIRMMGGLLRPSAGSIRIDGLSMAEAPVEVKKRIGFIPDRPYLYEKLTGMEFLSFTAALYGVDEKAVAAQADDLLRMFALFNWRHELVESYSHGMKQRLIIAAALLHDPRVVIVDEPMVGLDPSAVKNGEGHPQRSRRAGKDDLHVHPYPVRCGKPLPSHRHHPQGPSGCPGHDGGTEEQSQSSRG